ncbi:hypothetical protein HPB51_013862 [Rhipicephalus microplus]|uniref:RanBD1 domain-containing protein n=1 Tax=Rhipicephalus microplus TaxID=6941 RepID=A0A9J6F321_RHIMP|nr:hypothetical protein HPB51_013862 [Rhipicephalus microplus]
MKKMAQRESPQRGVQHALLQRERAALQLALERGRREPDQALASAVRAQLDDLEGRLINISNGSFSDDAAETSWAQDVTSTPRSTRVSFVHRPPQSSTPQVDRSFYPARADASHSSMPEVESPTRQPRGQTAGSAVSAAANEFVELQLRSLSLHQELVMSHLRQVLETNQNVLRELRDSHQSVLAEVKQQQIALEQLSKKVDDIATKAATAATASRAQRQRDEADYVEEYTTAYETDFDPYREYSHLEAAAVSGAASTLVAAGPPHAMAPPPAAPLGYPPQFRGAPYASYPPPPPPHLGYPLAPPPPPLARPLPPPLAPPQQFFSPQVAAAAAAVPTPGLCLAEGQPLPQFSFDISQPPPSTSVASSTPSHVASGDVGRVSAFSRLSKVPPPSQAPVGPPVTTITPAAPALPPKPPNAPHAFQIPLPATGSSPASVSLPGAVQGFSQPFPSLAAATPTASKSAAAMPQLHGLLTGSVPSLASVAPEKQEPMTTIGTRTAEASPVISVGSSFFYEWCRRQGLVCFEERAKLFRYDEKEWKERGIGVVKLLENKEGKVRLLMRREQVLKVCANHYIHSGMTLTPMPKKDTAWIWDAQDFADGEARPQKFCIRFKTPEIAAQFKEAFDQAVNKSKQAVASCSPAASTAASAAATLSMSPSPLRVSTITAPSKFESSSATTHPTFVISTPGFGTSKSVVMPPVFGSGTATTGAAYSVNQFGICRFRS